MMSAICLKSATLVSAAAATASSQRRSVRVQGQASVAAPRRATEILTKSKLSVLVSRPKRFSKQRVAANRASEIVRAAIAEPITKKQTTLANEIADSFAQAVFVFGPGRSEGDMSMKMSLGGKGANLAEMCSIGLSVPPGFTITTDTCEEFHLNGCTLPEGVWESVIESLTEVEEMTGKKFGDAQNPLLVSVRSGAAVSMPGMMDTVLNLGLNDVVVQGLAKKANSERFAYDSYRRFIDMFGDVVLGIPHSLFEHEIESLKQRAGVVNDNELSTENLKELVEAYKKVYVTQGLKFPEDPRDQLKNAIFAVFNSWNSERAIKFRAINKVSDLKGTAVNIQTMVFGNMGPTSGTGVCFTRNPSTGENALYGEYLINAQGEDVVAGIRTPEDIMRLKEDLPDAFDSLIKNCEILEAHYKDMQDIEFTVEDGKLWMLQTRSGKRTGKAAVKIAVDLVDNDVISQNKAITMVEPTHLDQLLHPQFEDEKAYKSDVVAKGLPASPGAAVGTLVFNSEDTEAAYSRGEKVILVRVETSPEDVGGMYAAAGILTARGGMTSHAAVVARGWGKCCISGCSEIVVDEAARTVKFPNGTVLKEGDYLSLNGSTGEVIMGKQPMVSPEISGDLGKFMAWVDGLRDIKVLANADTPEDAALARKNGAQGIGLVRTEHMFFGSDDRIAAVRQMIMATTTEERQAGLDKILPFQRGDFVGIFEAMDGLPVTIRLLDPPLHEFLPEGEDVEAELAALCGITPEAVLQRIESMIEVNPMLGFRGCRLAITYPEIATMQARAIMEAACEAQSKGVKAIPDIMVPLVGTPEELSSQKAIIIDTCEKVMKEKGVTVEYKIGTMIEIPRAALCADEIAKHAEFFSFGTNDLTQMTFGYSRDDVAKFLPSYLEKGILKNDPFEVIDQRGVGQLIQMATAKGRATKPGLKVGVCGEQGGEPSSVEFFHRIGLDYVSCSAFRVPIARLAAAQAKVKAQ